MKEIMRDYRFTGPYQNLTGEKEDITPNTKHKHNTATQKPSVTPLLKSSSKKSVIPTQHRCIFNITCRYEINSLN